MIKMLLLLLICLMPSLAWAEPMRCIERPTSGSTTVYGWVHFLDSNGVTSAATSKEAKVIREGQTATFATVADGSFVQSADRAGFYWIPVTIASTDTVGWYVITGRGTVGGQARDGSGESFELKAQCPLTPTVAGRQILCDASGNCKADLGLWLGVAPNALQSSRVDSYTGAMGNDTMTAAAMTDDLERRLGPFIKQITVTAGSTVAEVVSTSGLTETSANAYEKTIISCSTHSYTEPRRILRFDPATDKVIIAPSTTAGRTFSAAPATNDTCNIYAEIE